MPTRNVHLTDHFDSLIAAGIEAGRYSNASEAVRAGLRLLEKQEKEDQAKLEWLRTATAEAFAAFDRGEDIALDADTGIDNFMNEVLTQVRRNRAERNG